MGVIFVERKQSNNYKVFLKIATVTDLDLDPRALKHLRIIGIVISTICMK